MKKHTPGCSCRENNRRLELFYEMVATLEKCQPIVRGKHSSFTYGPFNLVEQIDRVIAKAKDDTMKPEIQITAMKELLKACKVILPKLSHRADCAAVNKTGEWQVKGSTNFDNCGCEIAYLKAAIAKAEGKQ